VLDYASSIKDFFSKKMKTLEGYYVIGECDDIVKKTIASNTFEVVISDVTIEKNIKHHNDLSIDDYLVLDSMFHDYHFLVKDGDKTAGIIYTKDIQYYYALKATKSGDTIFLTSFRKTNKNDIKRIKNKVKRGLAKIVVEKQN